MYCGGDGAKALSPTNQAMRNIDHMELETHSAYGLRCEEGNAIHAPVPQRTVWMMYVFACISMLLSAALFVLCVIFAFVFGLLLTGAHDTSLGAFVVAAFVISVFGAVAYLLTTLFVAVILRCSLCYRCRSSNATRLSCCEAVICALILLFSCALSCLTGFLLADPRSDQNRKMLTAMCVLTTFCTLSFGAFVVLLVMHGVLRR
ncbi:hypothetical protein LMJF_23_1440 [Leishmania major strain Friedlin]|uniref:Uncharacterized protein n=1 Tax=Leishmania major TaxID=5664 RepID=Q4QAZ5_LEIMA|nr:hypothetical protein LMJF_23_1440 [Leishmania major strain Friedlin]CAG9574432.1 hypothetical_protein_-_conserved [Leishmania major strain Friedlin]CAJ05021.1 hypothetical protein LMJF_23_1440 [Leishmania major strain Friedlin]|eukprot:XP_001683503.1 hypothetical protein LMJF_23_1440 [Leishmania major strain Friedlin]